MITAKQFSYFDACGKSGFAYDAVGNDITSQEILQEIRAIYDIQIDNGPWKKSWCSVLTHQSGSEAEIDSILEANFG